MLGALASYFLSYLIARQYGAEGNGVFALFMTYTVILSTVFYLGLDLFLVKQISSLISKKEYNLVSVIYKTILKKYLLIFLIVSFILSIIFLQFFENDIYALIILGIALNIFIDLHSAILQGMKKVEWYSYFTQLSKYFLTIIFILICFNSNDSDEIIVFYVSALFINALFSFFVLRNYLNRLEIKPNSPKPEYTLKNLFYKSKEFFFSSILIITLVWIDFIFIDLFLDKDDAGIYSVALKIATLISFSFTAFNAFLAPRISEIYVIGNTNALQKIITQNFLITLPMIATPFVIILIFKTELLQFFGDEFTIGSSVLIWLALGQFINSIFGPVSLLLQMTNQQKLFQNILIFSFILKLLSAFILIKLIGLQGIAMASTIALAFWTVLGSYFIKKRIGVYSWFSIKEAKLILFGSK